MDPQVAADHLQELERQVGQFREDMDSKLRNILDRMARRDRQQRR